MAGQNKILRDRWIMKISPIFSIALLWGARAYGDYVYVANYNSQSISVINTATSDVATIDLTPESETAYGLAISPDGQTLYATDYYRGSEQTLSVINTSDNTYAAGITVGDIPASVALTPDGAFAFVVAGDGSGTVTKVNTATRLTNSLSIGQNLYGVAIANTVNGLYAYVVDDQQAFVSVIDTATNMPIGTSSIAVGVYPHCIAIASTDNGLYAYVANSSTGDVSVIDTSTNTQVRTISIPGASYLHGIAAQPNNHYVYVTDGNNDLIYIIDTKTNTVVGSTISTPERPSMIAIDSAGEYAYVTNSGSNNVSVIALNTNSIVDTFDVGNYPVGIVVYSPDIPLTSLNGNNLKLANYFNANAPSSVVRLFSTLQGALEGALENAAPTRNAFSTFASQTAQLSLSRLVNDHLSRQRWRKHKQKSPEKIALLERSDDFVAESDIVAVNNHFKKSKKTAPCCQKNSVGLWVNAFGEYAHAKPKHQTPHFNTGSGGAVVASEYNGIYPNPIGAGLAYAHTHIHEEKDAGYANVDQGDVFIYGTFPVANWYFDTAIWGGYYHSKNVRDIFFTGYPGGEAKSKIHGWQLSPHLEMGYDHWMNWLGLEPFIMADYVACWEHRAREFGPTLLNFGQKGRYCSLVRGETGLRLQEVLSCYWGTVTFMEKASYAYQKAFHTGKINAFLIGSPGSFTVTTLTTAQNMGVGEIEILMEPNNKDFYASLAFHAEAGAKYQSYQGMVQLGKDF